MIVVGVGFLVYLHVKKELKLKDIEVLVVALSNCWGLILVFMFMPPGLVDIPKNLWRRRDILAEQEECEAEVGRNNAIQEELFYELENQIKILHNISNTTEGEKFKVEIDMILSQVPDDLIKSFPTGLDAYFPKELFEADIPVCYC